MKPQSHSIHRRDFIKRNLAATLAISAFPTLIPATVLGREGAVAANSRIVMGCIGTGPQGRGVMGNFLALPEAKVVAISDLIPANRDEALGQVKNAYKNADCAFYPHYEELLAQKSIDAVLIATPDHWHVPVAVAAARAKKDMYLEKPMGLSLEEDQLLRREIATNGRVFQFGTQQRSSSQFRLACELVRNGRIGTLKQIEVWGPASRPGGPTQGIPAPANIDYDRWLGPAPKQDYTDGKCFDTPTSWKTWWYHYDYALGYIAGWGIHPLDIANWGHPEMMKGIMQIEGKGVFPKAGACNTSTDWDVHFQFADGVRLRYRSRPNQNKTPDPMSDIDDLRQKFGGLSDHGTAFIGTEGWVVVDRNMIRTSPEKLVEEKWGANDLRLMASSNHARNLLEAVRTRGATICPIEEAFHADALCHLSDIASRLGRPLHWDPAAEKFLDDEEANRRLALRSTREPWRVKS
jgi:glucose-fructose oxidoreductase